MIPTAKLRFVERMSDVSETGVPAYTKRRILQQWWQTDPDIGEAFMEALTGRDPPAQAFEKGLQVRGEWRDVPLELE